jgi:hypothetical protein
MATADVLTNLHNLPIPAYTLVASFQGPTVSSRTRSAECSSTTS